MCRTDLQLDNIFQPSYGPNHVIRDNGCHFFTGFQVHHVIRAPFLLFLLYIHSAPLARRRDVRMFVQCVTLQMILASIIRPTDPTYPLPLHDHFCK